MRRRSQESFTARRAFGAVTLVLGMLIALAGPLAETAGAAPLGTTASTTTLQVSVLTPSGPGGNPAVGDTVDFSVTVADETGAAGSNPTGTVEISLGSTSGPEECAIDSLTATGSTPPLSSSGSCSATLPDAGTDTFVASYSGDGTFAASTGNGSVTSVDSLTSLSLSGTTTGLTVGNQVTLTATVAASSPGASATPTGTVGFADNNTAITGCTGVTLSGTGLESTASCTFTVTQQNDDVTALYAGDGSNEGSNGMTIFSATGAASTITWAQLNPTSPEAGDQITISATLTGVPGVAPTESIAVDVAVGSGSSTPLSTCSDQYLSSSEIATCTYSLTSSESVTFFASYGGDAGYAPVSPPVQMEVTPGLDTPVVTLSTSPSSPQPGSAGTVTATATGNGVVGAPTGAFTVEKGTSTMSSCSAPTTTADAESTTCTLDFPTQPGEVDFTAAVAADANYAAASASLEVSVGQVTPTVTVTAPVATVGSTVHVTALVTGSPSVSTPPKGAIEVFASGALQSDCDVTNPTSDTEQAVCDYTYPSTSPVTFTADVLASGPYNKASDNKPDVVEAKKASTKTRLRTTSNKPAINKELGLTATVSGPTAGSIETGYVEFFESSGPKAPYVPISTCANGGKVGLTLGAEAECATLPSRTTERFKAVYSGDKNYTSSSASLKPVIAKAPVFVYPAKVVGGSTPVPGSVVQISVTVTGGDAGGSPTGTVTLSGSFGMRCVHSCTVALKRAADAKSRAIISVRFGAHGSAPIKAVYNGSSVYRSGTGTNHVYIGAAPRSALGSPSVLLRASSGTGLYRPPGRARPASLQIVR